MKPVFADTSYYVALANPKDQWHSRAKELADALLGKVFVTDYVLVELGSALAYGSDRQVYVRLIREIQKDPATTIISTSHWLFEDALTLFAKRPDKDWSLVDCASIVVMGQRHLKEVLTTDHHFQQAGFKALLR